jgi:hypothetical protein
MAINDYMNGFKDGLKINNDLNNRVEGPHFDIMTDLRENIGGIDKIRISNSGNIIGGETQIGPQKIKW